MRKVLLITGELYPINSGASLHTYGYCIEFAKFTEFHAYSLYTNSVEVRKAEEIIRKDFPIKLVRPYSNIIMKILDGPSIIISNQIYMFPVYTDFYKQICNCINECSINTIIIDHVTMALYYKKLRKSHKDIRFIYNSHNVEYANIYDRYVKPFNGTKRFTYQIRHLIRYIKYLGFRKLEKELIESTYATFDISKIDIEILRKEYSLKQSRINVAKPLMKFERVKTQENMKSFSKKLLIAGSLNWYPNLNGIVWFVREVFSELIEKEPEYKLYLVGRGAGEEMKSLVALYPLNIVLVGEVPKTDDYFKLCDLSIVPVFEGTGAKIKVLESLGRGIITISSRFAAKDYDLKDEIPLCDTPNEFINAILSMEADSRERINCYKRIEQFISNYYFLNPEIKSAFDE